MKERLDIIQERYNFLCDELLKPEIYEDYKKMQTISKEKNSIEGIVKAYKKYNQVIQDIVAAKEMSHDEEMREFALEELDRLSKTKIELENKLKVMLLPKDPNDDKNVIVEIRGAAGGDEANIFAGDLFRMYSRYAERRRWKMELLSASDTGVGGYKEVSFLIKGKGAYSRLKYESGVHRVQRIPSTESGGRIHTSTATVAVLPEVETVEVNINPNDLRIDVFRSSGNGGQSVNTTDSAVRITHIPTGEVVSCQDGKSQLKNKEQALKILVARLNDKAIAEQNKDIAAERKSQVGTGDRSERIRTYNFPQGRVSDHRINLTLYKLDSFLDGDIDEMIDALITVDQTEKMASI
mgnify:CR=1 FL=1